MRLANPLAVRPPPTLKPEPLVKVLPSVYSAPVCKRGPDLLPQHTFVLSPAPTRRDAKVPKVPTSLRNTKPSRGGMQLTGPQALTPAAPPSGASLSAHALQMGHKIYRAHTPGKWHPGHDAERHRPGPCVVKGKACLAHQISMRQP